MKVKDLIEDLSKINPNYEVFIIKNTKNGLEPVNFVDLFFLEKPLKTKR